MERPVHQNPHLSRQFTDSQSVKMATQLLLSVSVLSIFFSHSTFPSFLHSLNFCFSTFPYQLFSHTLDKNCIFLICNGLLVFLAKYSGLVRFLSLSNHQDESRSKNITDGFQSELLLPQKKELVFLEKEVEVPKRIDPSENGAAEEGNVEEYSFNNQRDQREAEIEKAITEGKEQEQGSRIMASKEEETELVQVAEEEEEEEEEEENNWSKDGFLAEQVFEEEAEEEKDEEVGNGSLSTEELNKKFDEFILRMKEELRIEAQRQLIMAV